MKGLRCPVEKYICKNKSDKKCKHLCHCKFDVIIQEEDIDSIVCVTSGLKRGIIDEKESKKLKLDSSSIMSSSDLSGLGQLVDAFDNSDRVLSFG